LRIPLESRGGLESEVVVSRGFEAVSRSSVSEEGFDVVGAWLSLESVDGGSRPVV